MAKKRGAPSPSKVLNLYVGKVVLPEWIAAEPHRNDKQFAQAVDHSPSAIAKVKVDFKGLGLDPLVRIAEAIKGQSFGEFYRDAFAWFEGDAVQRDPIVTALLLPPATWKALPDWARVSGAAKVEYPLMAPFIDGVADRKIEGAAPKKLTVGLIVRIAKTFRDTMTPAERAQLKRVEQEKRKERATHSRRITDAPVVVPIDRKSNPTT